MKRLLFIIIAIPGLLLQSGCKKFLEEESLDEIRPATLQDLVALMASEGYPYQTSLTQVMEILTDDVQCNGGQAQASYVTVVKKGRAPYTWSKDMFEELLLPDGFTSTTYVNSWQILYNKIAGCNTVLGHLDKVTGDAGPKNNLRGQALAMRAYYYFLLVNMFGKPYNAPGSDPETSPGVPLKLRMEVTDSLYPRNSVAEVYRQIETDLKDGASLMEANPQNNRVYKINELAAYTLLSRVYLYQEKWDDCITYANKVIAKKPGLTQLGTFKGPIPGGYYMYNNGTTYSYSNRIYDPLLSPEILWTYTPIGNLSGGDEVFQSGGNPSYSNTLNPPYSVSAELLALYDARPLADTGIYLADLRSRVYLQSSSYLIGIISFNPLIINFGVKFTCGSAGMGGVGLRIAEDYLNRAEAKIQKAIKAGGNPTLLQEALNDLNTLRISRYDTRMPYVQVSITDAQELLSFCRDERRREFPFDGHRWFDLRRYGMPSISHFYEENTGTGQTFTLAKGDSRYTLPIPKAVLQRNAMLTQNP
ncbi:MAG TPA: RagB/SusD family nutrient uptake outer membrane protein [Chitinophagaceae bacterium]|jgi:hypothetical protein|nr:RagB/SusD family nutrient uptake outer membrane protein [Chitinophagaceae bacterium]